jgi:predicted GTPase
MGNKIINDNEENLTNDQIKKNLTKKMKSVERFCKGVIWLVTSDTLPTEENSW